MTPIRVALSGSGFKFPAHVGALLAIRDAGFEPAEIAGTSGGSIVAGLYAAGMDLGDMRALCMDQDWSDMLTFSPLSALTKLGYCSGNRMLEWLRERTGSANFAQARIPLTVVASDISASAPHVFSSDSTPYAEIALACRASASIPFAYAPVQLDGALLMDGGVCDNMPVDLLTDDGMAQIGIHLSATPRKLDGPVIPAWTIAGRLLDLMLSASDAAHARIGALEGKARMAVVDTGFVDGLNRNMSSADRNALFSAGYAATMAQLKQ